MYESREIEEKDAIVQDEFREEQTAVEEDQQ